MRCGRVTPLLTGFLLAIASPAQGQSAGPAAAALPFRFESWRPASASDSSSKPVVAHRVAAERDRGDQALLGGVIGAAVGVVSCTVISTLIDDSADGGLSFCPLDTFLLFTAGGFVLGAAVGWLIYDKDNPPDE